MTVRFPVRVLPDSTNPDGGDLEDGATKFEQFELLWLKTKHQPLVQSAADLVTTLVPNQNFPR